MDYLTDGEDGGTHLLLKIIKTLSNEFIKAKQINAKKMCRHGIDSGRHDYLHSPRGSSALIQSTSCSSGGLLNSPVMLIWWETLARPWKLMAAITATTMA